MPPALTDHSESPASSQLMGLVWPSLLLVIEATALTPLVEFSAGPMSWLAHPLLLSCLIFSLSALLLLLFAQQPETVAESLDAPPLPQPAVSLFQPWRSVRLRWGFCHLVVIALFTGLTIGLHERSGKGEYSWFGPVVWLLLGLGVAGTLALTFLPYPALKSLLRRLAPQTLVAAVLGTGMGLMISPVRDLWTRMNGPILDVLRAMLTIYPGNAVVEAHTARWPIIGTNKIALLVTSACSEFEALLSFLLLGVTLWIAAWEKFSPARFLGVLVAGLVSIYLLITVRLYMLILVGHWSGDAMLSVKLAHSRVSTLLLTGYTLVVLYYGARVAVPPAETSEWETEESLSAEEDSSEESELEPGQPAENGAESADELADEATAGVNG